MAAGDVAFGAFDLNDGTYTVLNQTPINASGPDLLRQPLAGREGSVVSRTRVPERTVEIRGVVRGSSAADREDKKDALLKALSNGEQQLKLGYQDERYVLARLVGEVQQQGLSTPFLWFYVSRFLCADPYAYAASASTATVSGAMTLVG